MPASAQPPSAASPEPARLLLVSFSVFFVSTALLMFEVLQTVTLSLQIFANNTFLVISVALLGLGAGGSVASVLTRRGVLPSLRFLWRFGVAYAVALLLAAVLASHTNDVTLLIILSFFPYFFAGVFHSLVLSRWPEHAGQLYCFNLGGSAAGCLLIAWGLTLTGDAAFLSLLIVLMALVGALCLAPQLSRRSVMATLVLAGLVLLLVPARDGLFLFLPSPDKKYGRILRDPNIRSAVDWSKWGYLGRLDSVIPGEGLQNYAYSGEWVQDAPSGASKTRILFANGGNQAIMIDFQNASGYRERFIRESVPSAPYLFFHSPDVLNIGVGGGVDPFLAVHHGARSVVGVEINPLMLEAVRERHPNYFDGVFTDPRVELLELDGRTYVRNTDRRFDVVTLTAVDTEAALAAGAYMFVQNHLYTSEAFDEYLRILKEDGVLLIYRPRFELLRVLATAAAALRAQGIDDPEKHLAVFGGTKWVGVILTKSPLSDERRSLLSQRLKDGYFGGTSYFIGGEAHTDAEDLSPLLCAIASDQEGTYLKGLKDDYSPIVDDRPYYYHYGRQFLASPAGQLITRILLVLGIAVVVLILAPLWVLRGGLVAPGWVSGLAFFGSIGLGFMLVEIAVMQKLALYLGHPTYALAVALTTILLFSGAGSIMVHRLPPLKGRALRLVLCALVALVVIYANGLQPLLEFVRMDSLALRALVVTVLLAPMSFLMGIPFPTMVRWLAPGRRNLVGWGWATNSVASVLASVFVVLISMNWGFSVALYVGAGCYLLALGFSALQPRAAGHGESAP